MLTQTREAVLGALFTLFAGVTFSQPVCGKTGFVTASRKLLHWSKVGKLDRPALFMSTQSETPVYRRENVPAYQRIRVRLFVYTDATGSTGLPDTDLSVILDALDTVLTAGFTGIQTLSGRVSHCRVDGEIIRDAGDLDGDGIILVPIEIALT